MILALCFCGSYAWDLASPGLRSKNGNLIFWAATAVRNCGLLLLRVENLLARLGLWLIPVIEFLLHSRTVGPSIEAASKRAIQDNFASMVGAHLWPPSAASRAHCFCRGSCGRGIACRADPRTWSSGAEMGRWVQLSSRGRYFRSRKNGRSEGNSRSHYPNPRREER